MILIAGPTASGKSRLAIELAKSVNGVVINADSMQVYDAIPILAARPDKSEMQGITHLLFGHVLPDQAYSVARWLKDAGTAINDVRQKGQVPILVGGTGLYFSALENGLSQIPPIDPDIRRQLRQLGRDDPEALYARLLALDPEGAAKIEPGDIQRLVRAAEVVQSTGKTLCYWRQQEKTTQGLPKKNTLRLLLTPEREILLARIEKRFGQMLKLGAVAEVEALLAMKLPSTLPVMRAIGVVQIGRAIAGEISLDEAAELSIIATRQYAKRQMTWFRNQFGPQWQKSDNINTALKNALPFINAGS